MSARAGRDLRDDGHPDDLFWYLSGRLDREAARRVESHLTSCRECRGIAATIEDWRGTVLAERPARAEHPPSELLLALEEEPDSLPGDVRERIDGHVRSCDSCREDVAVLREAAEGGREEIDALRQAEGDRNHEETAVTGRGRAPAAPAPLGPAARRGARWLAWGAAAAAAVVLITVGASRLWSPQGSPEAIAVWTPSERGEDRARVLPGAGPWTVRVVLPFEAPDGDYTVLLTRGDGRPVEAAISRAARSADGEISIRIPPIRGEGAFLLSLSPVAGAPGSPYLYPFHRRTDAAGGSGEAPSP